VVGGYAARGTARGGEGIQTPRPSRLITAAGALVAYGGAVADALTRDTSYAQALAPAVGLGVLLLVLALVRWEGALGWALGLCGATYVAAVVIHGEGVDGTAPVIAVLLLLCGELTAWSLSERGIVRVDNGIEVRRAITMAALAIAGLATAGLVVLLSGLQPGGGLIWTFLGVAAAVAVAGGAAGLARRS